MNTIWLTKSDKKWLVHMEVIVLHQCMHDYKNPTDFFANILCSNLGLTHLDFF